MISKHIFLINYFLDSKPLAPYSKKYFFILHTIFYVGLCPKKLSLNFAINYVVKTSATNRLSLYRVSINIADILKNSGFFIQHKYVVKKTKKYTVLRSVFADKKSREQFSKHNFSLSLTTNPKSTVRKIWKYYDSYTNFALQKVTTYCSIKLIRKCVNH